jgi:polyhydroxyalkanoate synthesis regulator phasin
MFKLSSAQGTEENSLFTNIRRLNTMEPKQIAQQMIDFYKATFDNSFKAMTMLQEQNEKMVDMFVAQASWLPEEGKKALNDWISAYKKGRDDFKKGVEESFNKVESFFAGFNKG